jgi:hypothetical protein
MQCFLTLQQAAHTIMSVNKVNTSTLILRSTLVSCLAESYK